MVWYIQHQDRVDGGRKAGESLSLFCDLQQLSSTSVSLVRETGMTLIFFVFYISFNILFDFIWHITISIWMNIVGTTTQGHLLDMQDVGCTSQVSVQAPAGSILSFPNLLESMSNVVEGVSVRDRRTAFSSSRTMGAMCLIGKFPTLGRSV
jgi:hypothetical protein